MKKYIGLFVVVTFMFSGVSTVSAEETGTNTGVKPVRKDIVQKREMELKKEKDVWREKTSMERKTFMEDLSKRRETFKTEIKTRKEEFRKASPEKKKEFWEKSKRMIGERFEVAIRNMERMQGRVAELITKLSGEGKDTNAATESLNLSKTKLSDAKAKIAEIKALVPANGEQITPETFEQIKLKAREAKDLLKEAHNNLKEAVRALKALKGEEDSSESSE
ncbi:MAG: hypothetical protein Q8O46_01155 [bacterium]|nr:hypothetical protein [bacterium]